ncbi:hypothetical protein [Streptomyces sp. NPDC051554]|uniref:hypothetical protein n=1 Tax=Streptomyces sp. NPDC051554 TaxID=3365656 RepID=UPI00378A9181
MSSSAQLLAAVEQLHRSKDAAYGNAWKKRGEVIGVLANLARKVDRLDSVIAGAPPTRDESLFDTAVDLFVYGLKYQTFLADLDTSVAQTLYAGAAIAPPYSDGPLGFEYLLTGMVPPDGDQVPPVITAAKTVAASFNDVEACFSLATAVSDPSVRLARARALTVAALILIGSLMYEIPALYREFIADCERIGHAH